MVHVCPLGHTCIPHDSAIPVKKLFQNCELDTNYIDSYYKRMVRNSTILASSATHTCNQCKAPLMIVSLEKNILKCKNCD